MFARCLYQVLECRNSGVSKLTQMSPKIPAHDFSFSCQSYGANTDSTWRLLTVHCESTGTQYFLGMSTFFLDPHLIPETPSLCLSVAFTSSLIMCLDSCPWLFCAKMSKRSFLMWKCTHIQCKQSWRSLNYFICSKDWSIKANICRTLSVLEAVNVQYMN